MKKILIVLLIVLFAVPAYAGDRACTGCAIPSGSAVTAVGAGDNLSSTGGTAPTLSVQSNPRFVNSVGLKDASKFVVDEDGDIIANMITADEFVTTEGPKIDATNVNVMKLSTGATPTARVNITAKGIIGSDTGTFFGYSETPTATNPSVGPNWSEVEDGLGHDGNAITTVDSNVRVATYHKAKGSAYGIINASGYITQATPAKGTMYLHDDDEWVGSNIGTAYQTIGKWKGTTVSGGITNSGTGFTVAVTANYDIYGTISFKVGAGFSDKVRGHFQVNGSGQLDNCAFNRTISTNAIGDATILCDADLTANDVVTFVLNSTDATPSQAPTVEIGQFNIKMQ